MSDKQSADMDIDLVTRRAVSRVKPIADGHLPLTELDLRPSPVPSSPFGDDLSVPAAGVEADLRAPEPGRVPAAPVSLDGSLVGFDLDLTLIDSRPGIEAVYRQLSAADRRAIDADRDLRIGPPLDGELRKWFPAEQIADLAEPYRALYPAYAIDVVTAAARRAPTRSRRCATPAAGSS